MRLILLISLVILIVILIGISNKEKYDNHNNHNNDVVNLGSNLITTENNIFYGFDSKQADDIRNKLEKFDELNLSKSNIFIDSNQTFNNLYLDNNKINGSELNVLRYHTNYDNRKVIFKQNNKDVFFNHVVQKNINFVPNKLCIGNSCITKDHVAMINGSNTIKLKNYNKYLQPQSLHYSGKGEIFTNLNCQPDAATDACPVQNIFYTMARKENPYCDYRLQSTNLAKYNMFFRFGLQAPDGRFLRAYANGAIDLAPHFLTSESFIIPNGYWFRRFINSENFMSFPLGIMSYHGKFLCHERHWLYDCDSIKAIWNRTKWLRWEQMSFITAIGTKRKDLAVYIYSHGCGGILQTSPIVHFTKVLNPDYCTFKIVPVYPSCSEGCKADYLSNVACCGAETESEIPKNLQCPRDRPKCRFYYPSKQNSILGRCFKEDPKDDPPGSPKFFQTSPHHCKFATANRSGFINESTAGNMTNNDTMFNEYNISLARNEKNQLYEKDQYSHIHSHGHETEPVSNN